MNSNELFQSRLIKVSLIIIICWIVFGIFIAPHIIKLAYHQQSHPFINQIISGSDVHSLKLYTDKWQKYFLLGLFCLVAYPALFSGMCRKRFWQKCVGVSSAQYLSLMRIFACFALLVIVLLEDLASVAYLPPSLIEPMGMMNLFYALPIGFDEFLTSRPALGIFHILTGVFLILGLIGYKHRIFIPLGALFYLVLGGIIRQYSHLLHPGLVPFYVLCVLSFAPCADVWSVDAHLKKKEPSAEAAVYSFYRYACWIVIALPYMFSGLSKLRNGGFYWWDSLNLKAIMLRDSLEIKQVDFDGGLLMKDLPDFVFSLLGIFTISGEALFVLVLFFSGARFIFPALMILMHIGIILTQNVVFLDLIILLWIFPVGEMLAKKAEKNGFTNEVYPSAKRAFILSSIAALFIFSWVFRVEHYPLTAWQMYSQVKDREVTYYKVLSHHDSGRIDNFYPHQIIGAMRFGRVRDRVGHCFTPDNPFICRDFYLQCGRLYNNREENNDKIKAIEVQKWKWDFVNNLSNTSYGYLKDNKVITVK